MLRCTFCLLSLCAVAAGQQIRLREAPLVAMPGRVDSNSPAFWLQGDFHVLNSTGGEDPVLSRGADQFNLSDSQSSPITRRQDWPAWMEAVWVDADGVVFGWYHQEHEWLCGAHRPAEPRIGAAVSYDGGQSFFELGPVLTSGDRFDCSSQNGYIAGGHGDFSVVLDQNREFFYFLFTNYAGPTETQGVAIARMPYDARYHPVGAVWKYHNGGWDQPGVGGTMTPIFAATVNWQREDTDSFWGPSVHWNTHLGKYVMLLNRSCCSTGFPQEGIYVSLGLDLSDPGTWSTPQKILDDPGWYPQVLGTGPGETDSLAGRTARLYIYGQSRWELMFGDDPVEPAEPVDPTGPGSQP